MQQTYTKNYIKIYSVQILSMTLGFVSLFIVVPHLSDNKSIYGIYSICLSVSVFLSYADLGFLGAGMKYAAENYSRNGEEEEYSIIGFVHFIFFVFVLLLSGIFLFLSSKPEFLIKNIESGYQYEIARKLLFILAISSPIVVGQRMLQMIFSIRLQEYRIQIINIIGSVIKIISVFFFFGRNRYRIIEYYLFLQIISLLVVIAGFCLAKFKQSYDLSLLFRHFKLSKKVFNQTKGLAISSLFVTVTWILYYELDSVAIGKLIGAHAVSIYAIGFTLLGFTRSIFGVFFTPFSARFNHFIGLGLESELKSFYKQVMTLTLPIVVFPLVAAIIMAKPLIISWVGLEYQESVVIVQILFLCNILAFISYPAGIMFVAKEKLREMYAVNALLPLVFWAGVILTLNFWQVRAFAVFKTVAFLLSGFFYLRWTLKYLNISIYRFFKDVVILYLPGLIIMSTMLCLFRGFCINDKNKLNLLYNILFIIGGCGVAFVISLITSKQLRQFCISVLKNVRR